eukprot:gene15252-32317_t
MRILRPKEFVPSGKPQKLRASYKRVAPAVHKMVFEILITDPTYSDKGVSCLNSQKTRDLVENTWGEIRHPTLEDIINMILVVKDTHGDLSKATMWKMDLANAFGLMDVFPEHAKLCCNALEGNLTLMYTQGWFGWTGTSFAFDVISRSLRNRLQLELKGVTQVYVDDIFGCCLVTELDHDLNKTRETAKALLGPLAIAEEKTDTGRILEVIGWSFDLEKEVVFLAKHNFLKTFYGFFEIDLARPVSYAMIERLASWASRYVSVAPVMKPHVGGFYRLLAGIRNRRLSLN